MLLPRLADSSFVRRGADLVGGMRSEERRDRFVPADVVLGLVGDVRELLAIGHGAVEGEILTTPRGTQGFGYDPLFYLPEQNKTMAELDINTKLTFSHRGRAFTGLLAELASHLVPST